MTHLYLASAAFALTLAGTALIGATPGRADAGAPFCSTINTLGGGSTRCDFYTYAQCQATVAGLAGTCMANPAFQDSLNRMPPSRRRSAY